jgi:hypothetical protein
MFNRRIISVLVARVIRPWKDSIRWQVDPHLGERRFVTLLIRLNEDNSGFQDFYVFARINEKTRFRLTRTDPYLRLGVRLDNLSGLPEAVRRLARKSVSSE